MVMMAGDVDLSLSQFVNAWKVMCEPSAAYRGQSRDGLEFVFSGLPIAFFNAAFATGRDLTAEALAASGREACAWAAESHLPWLYVATRETLQPGVDPVQVLDDCGLVQIMTLTGMKTARLTPEAEGRAADLTKMVAADEAACASMLDINGVAYGMDLEAGKALLGAEFWRSHVPVVGYAGGAPVSCAAVLMVDGLRYVAMVATDPAHQRRGFAESVMRRALDIAADRFGDSPTVLHATDAGKPVYARMGYTEVSTHPIFMEKRFLEGH
jgi:ribosomal protein S18 acetylase RimI-like enzyme